MNALREQFISVIGGRNFMTPNVIEYRKITNGVAEISTGRGFSGQTIYGVTVVRHGEHDHDKSDIFYSMEDAERHINSLK